METACAQFLNAPELLSLVTSYLAPMDISRLCRTSHRMHVTCTPSLYRDLFISSFEKESTIFASTQCRHAFRRNIGHVRSLTIGPIELHYYYNCLRVFEETRPHNLDASATPALTASSTSASSSSSQIPSSSLPQSPTSSSPSLPRWLPPAVHRTHPVEPLPPMTNLQHLVLTDNTPMNCSYRLPKFNDDRMIMAECCWIISLNPRLEHLSSNYNASLDVLGYRLLAAAISGLSRLTTLDISVLCHADQKFNAGAEILFSCCPSIRKIKIVTADASFDYSNEFLDDDFDDAFVDDDVDWLVGTRKLEPLVNLEELDFWDVMDSASTEDLLTVFEHCPNIQKLNVLTISDLYDHDVLGEFIGQNCPKIRSLTCGSPFVGLEVGGPLLFKIMESLPAQTVEDIYFYGAFDGFIESSLTLATLRHSTTLSRIEIEWIYPLAKVSLSAIFEECVNLERLDVRCNRCWGRMGLYTTLTNVLERPWNTSKLANLSLSISVNDLPVVLQAQEQTQRAVAISELRQAHSGRLDELTRRVMSLPGGQGKDVTAGIVTVEDENQLVFTKIK